MPWILVSHENNLLEFTPSESHEKLKLLALNIPHERFFWLRLEFHQSKQAKLFFKEYKTSFGRKTRLEGNSIFGLEIPELIEFFNVVEIELPNSFNFFLNQIDIPNFFEYKLEKLLETQKFYDAHRLIFQNKMKSHYMEIAFAKTLTIYKNNKKILDKTENPDQKDNLSISLDPLLGILLEVYNHLDPRLYCYKEHSKTVLNFKLQHIPNVQETLTDKIERQQTLLALAVRAEEFKLAFNLTLELSGLPYIQSQDEIETMESLLINLSAAFRNNLTSKDALVSNLSDRHEDSRSCLLFF